MYVDKLTEPLVPVAEPPASILTEPPVPVPEGSPAFIEIFPPARFPVVGAAPTIFKLAPATPAAASSILIVLFPYVFVFPITIASEAFPPRVNCALKL